MGYLGGPGRIALVDRGPCTRLLVRYFLLEKKDLSVLPANFSPTYAVATFEASIRAILCFGEGLAHGVVMCLEASHEDEL